MPCQPRAGAHGARVDRALAAVGVLAPQHAGPADGLVVRVRELGQRHADAARRGRAAPRPRGWRTAAGPPRRRPTASPRAASTASRYGISSSASRAQLGQPRAQRLALGGEARALGLRRVALGLDGAQPRSNATAPTTTRTTASTTATITRGNGVTPITPWWHDSCGGPRDDPVACSFSTAIPTAAGTSSRSRTRSRGPRSGAARAATSRCLGRPGLARARRAAADGRRLGRLRRRALPQRDLRQRRARARAAAAARRATSCRSARARSRSASASGPRRRLPTRRAGAGERAPVTSRPRSAGCSRRLPSARERGAAPLQPRDRGRSSGISLDTVKGTLSVLFERFGLDGAAAERQARRARRPGARASAVVDPRERVVAQPGDPHRALVGGQRVGVEADVDRLARRLERLRVEDDDACCRCGWRRTGARRPARTAPGCGPPSRCAGCRSRRRRARSRPRRRASPTGRRRRSASRSAADGQRRPVRERGRPGFRRASLSVRSLTTQIAPPPVTSPPTPSGTVIVWIRWPARS